MFATIWLYDTGAYLVGVAIGKHKMFERISPKKTWEGFAGGALVAILVGYVCSIFITDISLVSWLFFAVIVGFRYFRRLDGVADEENGSCERLRKCHTRTWRIT